jgi:hypothetical protein
MRALSKKIPNPLNCLKAGPGSVRSDDPPSPRASLGSHLSGLTGKLRRKTNNESKEFASKRSRIKDFVKNKLGVSEEEADIPFFQDLSDLDISNLPIPSTQSGVPNSFVSDEDMLTSTLQEKSESAKKLGLAEINIPVLISDRATSPLAPKLYDPTTFRGSQGGSSTTSLESICSSVEVINTDSDFESEKITAELEFTPANSFSSLGLADVTHINTEELQNLQQIINAVMQDAGSVIATSDDTNYDTPSSKT